MEINATTITGIRCDFKYCSFTCLVAKLQYRWWMFLSVYQKATSRMDLLNWIDWHKFFICKYHRQKKIWINIQRPKRLEIPLNLLNVSCSFYCILLSYWHTIDVIQSTLYCFIIFWANNRHVINLQSYFSSSQLILCRRNHTRGVKIDNDT